MSAPSYWAAASRRPFDAETLRGTVDADVAIVGAGLTGLWAALHLTEAHPGMRVAILEQDEVGFGASGRNGGFCSADFTHGFLNGLRHFPDEIRELDRLGVENLREMIAFLDRNGIDCDLEATGLLKVADQPHHVAELAAAAETMRAYGVPARLLDRDEAQAEVHSPVWHGALELPGTRTVLLDPAKLCWGLARVARERGVRIFERSRVRRVARDGFGVRVVAAGGGCVRAQRLIVATSAYSRWLRALRPRFVPVYDYLMVSEPLTPAQRDAIGWRRRQGLVDSSNRFHYFRLTPDDRILWGGFDAVYHFGSRVGPALDQRPQTFALLEEQFAATFPQLAGLRFPHRWGGAIDSTMRFTVVFGTLLGGRGVSVLGYTGHGVGATRWAAQVATDMLLAPDSELLRLRIVNAPALPFPPEPLRSAAVRLMQRELERADGAGGRRGLVLRTLDRLGIGFDS